MNSGGWAGRGWAGGQAEPDIACSQAVEEQVEFSVSLILPLPPPLLLHAASYSLPTTYLCLPAAVLPCHCLPCAGLLP